MYGDDRTPHVKYTKSECITRHKTKTSVNKLDALYVWIHVVGATLMRTDFLSMIRRWCPTVKVFLRKVVATLTFKFSKYFQKHFTVPLPNCQLPFLQLLLVHRTCNGL